MSAWTVGLGLVILVGLGATIGIFLADERRHHVRVRLDAWQWRLWRWEQELISAAECRSCPSCRLLRQRAELLRTPSDGPGGD